jgi:hypothetical protein
MAKPLSIVLNQLFSFSSRHNNIRTKSKYVDYVARISPYSKPTPHRHRRITWIYDIVVKDLLRKGEADMSFIRGLFFAVAMLGVAVLSTGAFAAVPLIMTHQGRLLDAADKPVNGVFDITYRVFDVPTGGSLLWTEVHPSVQVTDGLFSALLGSTVPLSADVLGSGGGGGGGVAPERYLEVSVGGVVLTPRLRLGSAPSAISTGHVSGDIETSPGLVVIGDTLTDNYATFGEKVNQGLHAAGGALASGKTRITNDCDGSSASQVMEKKGLNAVNVKLARMISSPPSGPVATDALDVDSDDDGVMDRSVSSGCDGTGARSILKGGMSGSTTGTIRMMATPDSAVSTLAEDSDGDGIPESSLKQKSSHGSASSTILGGMSGSTTGTIRMQATGGGSVMPSGEIVLGADLDGDGVMDVTSADSVDATGASRRLKSSGIGSSGNDGVEVQLSARPRSGAVKVTASQNSQSLRCSSSADSATARMLLEADLDGDGAADNSMQSTCDASSVKIILDRDSGRSRALMTAGDTGSKIGLDYQGIQAFTATSKADSTKLELSTPSGGANLKGQLSDVKSNLELTNSGGSKLQAQVNEQKSNLSLSGSSGDESVDVAVDNGMGPGAHPSSSFRLGRPTVNTALVVSDESGVNLKTQSSGRNIGLYVSGTSGQCKVAMVDATLGVDDTTIVIDGNLKRFGIGVSQPDSPIQHSSGARLTAAGDWTNASDRNLKENFSKVDGEELLEKIEELPISRWNYKVDSDNVTHIGPTAQDFKAAFGVGANDKTISTIDPSGIALAAIKALNCKMRELDAKTNEIAQLKAELDAIKAMLQKQADTKN